MTVQTCLAGRACFLRFGVAYVYSYLTLLFAQIMLPTAKGDFGLHVLQCHVDSFL